MNLNNLLGIYAAERGNSSGSMFAEWGVGVFNLAALSPKYLIALH